MTEGTNHSSILIYVSECNSSMNDLTRVARNSLFSMNVLNPSYKTDLILSRSHFDHNLGRLIYVRSAPVSTMQMTIGVHENVFESNIVPLDDLIAFVTFWFQAKDLETNVDVFFTDNILTSSYGTGFRFVIVHYSASSSAFLHLTNSIISNIQGPAMYAICVDCDRHRLNVSIQDSSFSGNVVPNPRIGTVNIDNCVL